MSRYTLEAFGPAPHSTHLGLRDRALLLIPTNTAFRGDSTRRVLWSDFFWKSIPVPLIGEDTALDVSSDILPIIVVNDIIIQGPRYFG